MKISIVDGETPKVKYIAAGPERAVVVRNFSDDNKSYHAIEWKTDSSSETVLEFLKKLYSEARYDYDREDKGIDEEAMSRGISLARRTFRGFHPQPDFWKYTNPVSQLQEQDVCLRMITPHYQIYCLNLSSKYGNEELPLYIDEIALETVSKKSIKEKVNRIEVITNFNICNSLSELVTITSPAFTQDQTTVKVILTQKFDQLLAQYKKPTKLH